MADKTNAQIGSKTEVFFWPEEASPEFSPMVWTKLGNVRSISGLGVARPETDSTDTDSDAVERIGGLPDGKQITLVLVANQDTVPAVERFVNLGENVDLKFKMPAPLSTSRYLTIVPLDYDHGSITPTGLREITLIGRITGSVKTVDTHGA